jgi:hypothetical protein
MVMNNFSLTKTTCKASVMLVTAEKPWQKTEKIRKFKAQTLMHVRIRVCTRIRRAETKREAF